MVVPIKVFKAVYPTSLLRVAKSNLGLHNKCPRRECLNGQAYVRSSVTLHQPPPSSEPQNNTKIGKICQSAFGNAPFSTSSIAACDLRPTKPISPGASKVNNLYLTQSREGYNMVRRVKRNRKWQFEDLETADPVEGLQFFFDWCQVQYQVQKYFQLNYHPMATITQ